MANAVFELIGPRAMSEAAADLKKATAILDLYDVSSLHHLLDKLGLTDLKT